MAVFSDIVAQARATVGHIVRFVRGGRPAEQPNRKYLDFTGNCTVTDTGEAILVTVPDLTNSTVAVGRVITLPAGSMAYVRNVGTHIHAVLEFGIPQGGFDVQGTIVGIHNGGTGSSTASGARESLDVPSRLEMAAVDAACVHLNGEENIVGRKVFAGGCAVPTMPVDDVSANAASTAFVRAYVEKRLAEIFYWSRDAEG